MTDREVADRIISDAQTVTRWQYERLSRSIVNLIRRVRKVTRGRTLQQCDQYQESEDDYERNIVLENAIDAGESPPGPENF